MARKIPIYSDDEIAREEPAPQGGDAADDRAADGDFTPGDTRQGDSQKADESQTSNSAGGPPVPEGGEDSMKENEDQLRREAASQDERDESAEQRKAAAEDSAQDIDKMRKELEEKNLTLEEAQKQRDEYLEDLKRMKAEFENFKRRTTREKADTVCFANEKLLGKLLPIMDNLQRGRLSAAEHIRDDQEESVLKGIELVEKQLAALLEDFGAKAFDSLDEKFDPNFHEPLYTVPRDDVEDGIVIEEIEKGYMLNERLLRPAKVAVSRAEG